MFDTPQKRAFLRAAVSATLAVLVVASGFWVDNVYVQMAGAAAGVFSAYLGVGAAVPQVEPNLGNKLEDGT